MTVSHEAHLADFLTEPDVHNKVAETQTITGLLQYLEL